MAFDKSKFNIVRATKPGMFRLIAKPVSGCKYVGVISPFISVGGGGVWGGIKGYSKSWLES